MCNANIVMSTPNRGQMWEKVALCAPCCTESLLAFQNYNLLTFELEWPWLYRVVAYSSIPTHSSYKFEFDWL